MAKGGGEAIGLAGLELPGEVTQEVALITLGIEAVPGPEGGVIPEGLTGIAFETGAPTGEVKLLDRAMGFTMGLVCVSVMMSRRDGFELEGKKTK
jgi:hypothetical protein